MINIRTIYVHLHIIYISCEIDEIDRSTICRSIYLIYISNIRTWQIALKMLHPWNPPNRETQIPRYKFKVNQIHKLNCTARYRGIWVSRFGGFGRCSFFSGKCYTEYIECSHRCEHGGVTSDLNIHIKYTYTEYTGFDVNAAVRHLT